MRRGVYHSGVYEGTVYHKRLRPRVHAFRYRVFSLLLDLDELPALDRGLALFSHNRWNLFSFMDRDHGSDRAASLRAWVDERLAGVGIAIPGGRVTLLCYPRILGYVFNPLSVYFCHRAEGGLAAVIYEVSNTFGERHAYVLPHDGEGGGEGAVRQSCRKAFYVSPFNDVSGGYRFQVLPPADRVSIHIDQQDSGGKLFRAGFAGRRAGLSDRALLGLALRYPLMTLKVIAAIHWEAFRLLIKGVPLRLDTRNTGGIELQSKLET
ncbi:DUF1365 domain-containing protein [Dongia sp. agr-C8]